MVHQRSGAGGAVYVQTDDAAGNEVLAFERRADGRLASPGRFAAGGRGTGTPHLASQGSIVLSDDGGQLLVVNAGSDELFLLVVDDDGLHLADRVASGGRAPTSEQRPRAELVSRTGDAHGDALPRRVSRS